MDKYKVDSNSVSFCTGQIELTKDQAKVRAYGLKKTNKVNIYDITQKIEFKRGEILGLKDVSKGMQQYLKSVDEDREKEKKIEPKKSNSK